MCYLPVASKSTKMSSPCAVSLNNAAVEELRHGRIAPATQLLERAWESLYVPSTHSNNEARTEPRSGALEDVLDDDDDDEDVDDALDDNDDDKVHHHPGRVQEGQFWEALHQEPHLVPPSPPFGSPLPSRSATPNPTVDNGDTSESNSISNTSSLLLPQQQEQQIISLQAISADSVMIRVLVSRKDIIVQGVDLSEAHMNSSSKDEVSLSLEVRTPPTAHVPPMEVDAPAGVRSNISSSNNNSNSSVFIIYMHAFVFEDHQDNDMDLLRWLRYVPHIPAVLLYNTGLVYHMLALQTGSIASLEKSLELYKSCQLLMESNATIGYYASELDNMILALRNNMGHCHMMLNQIDEARICLEEMSTIFLCSVSTVFLSNADFAFFYRVVALLVATIRTDTIVLSTPTKLLLALASSLAQQGQEFGLPGN